MNRIRTIILLALLLLCGPSMPAHAQSAPARPDLGDAPDSTNAAATPMHAYPGVMASFPTSLQGGGAFGPLHRNQQLLYYLGSSISAEAQAEAGPDADQVNNLVPANDSADNDTDNGLVEPGPLAHCTLVKLRYRVTVSADAPPSLTAILNLWADWNRDGSWAQTAPLPCAAGQSSSEWPIQNMVLALPGPGSYLLTTPPILVWNSQPTSDLWLRMTLSEGAGLAGGAGPADGFLFGETEDYRLEGQPPVIQGPPRHQIDAAPFKELTAAEPPTFQVDLPLVARPPSILGSDDFAVPGGKLKEVDVAHIGGSTGGPSLPIVVTAAGTGATVQLSSWRVTSSQEDPKHLSDSPNIVGYNVKLHTLTPDISPDLTYNLLVSGVLDTQSNLWLTTWRLEPSGAFVKLATRGYGARDIDVREYAIAHRPILRENGTIDAYQVVTPVRTASGQMRLITWSVNPATGAINGRQDSGAWGSPDSDTQIAVVRMPGGELNGRHYTVHFRDSGDIINTWLWDVNNAHVPFYRGEGDSGRDIRGANQLTLGADEIASAPLNGSGFLLAHQASSGLRISSWENRRTFCSDTGCLYTPYRIATNTDDGSQMAPGVLISQPSVTTSRALLVDARGGTTLAGATTMFQKGDNNQQGVASVRKVMVLLVTIDALEAGEVALGDLVTVSEDAANHPGSSMGLEAGEVQTLGTLIHGMMMPSGGDATQAIIQHVGGTDAAFLARVVAKADELGMDDSLYCGTGSYCYSTTADQVRLWLGAYQNPLFQQFAGAEFYDACGELEDGTPKCYSFSKNVSSLYPGVQSHKTGGTGFRCADESSPPLCAASGCLSVQATRLEHTLVLSELQPAPLAADRWNDAYDLFDFGFRQLFTPDYRGANLAEGGPASDFGVAVLDDTQFVSAALSGGKLKLCSWQVVAGIGQVGLLACAERSYSMPGGAQEIAPTALAIELLGTLEADGDYLSGHLEAGQLTWRVWRVAQKP